MKRLTYSEDTKNLLMDLIEGEKCYWRYQDSEFGGIIPVGHCSYERCACDEDDAEYVEEGCSCYDNPWQLVKYMDCEGNGLDDTDVIMFVGSHMGTGLDEEDIVLVEEESDILYSMSLRDFYKVLIEKIDNEYYWNTLNVKEMFLDFTDDYIEDIFSK